MAIKVNEKAYTFDESTRFWYASRRRRKLAQNLEQLQALLLCHDLQLQVFDHQGHQRRYIVYSQTRRVGGQAKVVGYGLAHVFVQKDGSYNIDDDFSYLDADPDLLTLLDRNPLHLELFEVVPKRRHRLEQADLLKVANALSGQVFEHLDMQADRYVKVTAGEETREDLLRFLRERLADGYDITLEEGGYIAVRRPCID